MIFPTANEPGFVQFKDPSGNLYRFWDTGEGTYVPYAGYTASLTKNTGTPVTYTLQDQARNVYTFDESGKVTTLVNSVGQTLTYKYENGKLDRVSYDAAHYLEFHYDPENPILLKSVNDQTGTHAVTFYYDGNGDLDKFEDVLGHTWKYDYQDHLLSDVLDHNERDDHDDLVLHNEYDADGRALKQFDGRYAANHNIKPIVALTYNANGTTTVTDANGVRTHTYDPAGTLTGDLNESGGDTIKSYDNNFRPKTIVDPDIPDPDHRTTTLDWSDDGANLKYIQDALDGETILSMTTQDDPNNPTEITDPLSNKTTYEYSNVYFPTLPTKIEYRDANGIVVSSTSYDYYDLSQGASAGKAERVTDAVGHKTHYTYTLSGQPDVVVTAYQTLQCPKHGL